MKLQIAGTTEPQNPGCDPSGSSSMRPSWYTTSSTGTSWRWSRRWTDDAVTAARRSARVSPSA